MKFDVSAELSYTVLEPTTLIINIHALRTPNQTALEESLQITPYFKAEELLSLQGENRFIRVVIPEPCDIHFLYKATVDNYFKITDHYNQQEMEVSQLDMSVFPYLHPSRYCQSDKLYRLANNKFGKIDNPYTKVIALTDWIHRNVEYLSGSTNSETSAYDTVTEQAGVCRDFAHLGIALCRALTIPARYCTAYAFKLDPPDFHACFEAYIGGDWVIFDATKLAPLNGLVKIATGRDAADTAIANIFGKVNFTAMNVGIVAREEYFEPIFYDKYNFQGVSYP